MEKLGGKELLKEKNPFKCRAMMKQLYKLWPYNSSITSLGDERIGRERWQEGG